MTTSSDESFLARWSRLKRQPDDASREDLVCTPDAPLNDTRAGDAQTECDGEGTHEPGSLRDAREAAPAVRDFSDFNFEALDYQSDYTQFMGKDVPRDVRNKALRKLWLSDPVLANLDGLDDYCDDYTDAAVVPAAGIKTVYRIGKGFLSDAEVAEWEALGRPLETVVVAEAETRDEDEAVDTIAANGGTRSSPDDFDDAAACPGAACAAVVKQEEQAALDDYDGPESPPARGDIPTDDADKAKT